MEVLSFVIILGENYFRIDTFNKKVSKEFSLGRDRSDGSKVGQKVILPLDNKFCLIFRVKLTLFLTAAELSVAERNIQTKVLGFEELLCKFWYITF